jgi:glycosyltransferase involved in cell wall biosynthesis
VNPSPRRRRARDGRRLARLGAAPRVSCIVTAYNYAEYLPEALESALAQDYPADRLEIVVVDDGSTDATPEVLARYADRVNVIRQPNGGVNAATTTGLAAASGQVLTFLDGDDAWPADRLRLLIDGLHRFPRAGIAYGDMEVIDVAGETLHLSLRAAGGVPALSGRQFGRLAESNFISGGAMAVRAELRDLFHPIPPFAGYQDWWIAVQAARATEVVAIPGTVNRYRLHGANANLGATGERRARLCESEIPFRRWLLRSLEPKIGIAHVVAAIRAFDANLGMLAGLRTALPSDLLGLSADDRTRAVQAVTRASEAIDRQALGRSLLHLAAAVGHDPLWDQPRLLIDELVPALTRIAKAQSRRVAVTS